MKSILNHALAEVSGGVKGLRAVVLSAAPDGLIAWSWSADGKHEIALGFAALDRAATACLGTLGASDQARSLLLTAKDCWVASWPLHEVSEAGNAAERLIVTSVFEGQLQSGMVMVYGNRVRCHLREVLDRAREPEIKRLHRALVDYLAQVRDPAQTLERLGSDLDINIGRLASVGQLHVDERQRLAAWLARPVVAGPRLLS